MNITQRLEAIFREVINEANNNPGFAERLGEAISSGNSMHASLSPSELPDASHPVKRGGRRTAAILNPYELYSEGEEEFRSRLKELNIEQLKDIVAEHGMDTMRLAMKWKTPERLIDLIISTVAARSRKGDAFRDS